MSFADFEVVLKNVANPDNGVRQHAELQIAAATQNPDWLISALLDVSTTTADPVVAHTSLVLLRRYLAKTGDALYDRLSAAKKAEVKAQLLVRIAEAQPSAPLRRGIAHCIAGLGCHTLDTWPELLPALAATLQTAGAPEVQQAVLLVFAALAPHFSDAALASHAASLRDLCSFALQQPSVEVQAGAIEVLMELVAYMRHDAQWQPLQGLLPAAIAAVGRALAGGHGAAAERSVQAFITVAEVTPEFFLPHLKAVVAPFLDLAAAPGLDPAARRLAFEFALTLAEADPKAARRLPPFVQASVPLAMQMLLEVTHGPGWAEMTPEEAEGEEPDFEFGAEALDRLAGALGGRRVHPVAAPLIAHAAAHADWRQRHAALWALSQVAEGCAQEFEPLLAQIAPLIAAGMADPHERVRHAAITCMAQFCTEFHPQWQAAHHAVFLPLLMERLADGPRVAGLAALACINFLEGAEREATAPHLDALCAALLAVLRGGRPRFVAEAAVAAVTALAAHAEGAFAKYYDAVVPYLSAILTAPTTARADRMLRARALECISRVALAVGQRRFAADAGPVLRAMERLQRGPLEADDPGAPYLLRAWGRLATYLTAEHHALLLPVLLAQLEAPTDLQISDDEGAGPEEDGVETLTLAIKGLGEKRITIRTSALEDKALAVAVLAQLLEAGPPVPAAFLERLAAALRPALRFAYVADVRRDAAACLPGLLRGLSLPDGAALVAQMAPAFVEALAEAIRTEPKSAVRSAQLQALSGVIDAAPVDCLSLSQVTALAELLRKVLTDSGAARDRLRTAKRGCDEEDAEALDTDIEAEEEVLCEALDVTTSLLKRSAAFLPLWESGFFPHYRRLLGGGPFETRLALCACAAFVEAHGPAPECEAHLPAILPALLEHCRPDHDDPDVAQVAAYGLGVACAHGPLAAHIAPAAVERLAAVVRARRSDEDWGSAVCNAAAALLRAHQGQPGTPGCGSAAALPPVLDALPVTGDEAAGRGVHRRVLELLAAGDPVVALRRAAILAALRPIRDTAFADAETTMALEALG